MIVCCARRALLCVTSLVLIHRQACRRIVAAGRSEASLQAAADSCTGASVAVLGGIDVTQPQSLAKMAASAALVLNCVGPYRHFGEPVVKACIDGATDYLDVCGEPGAAACARRWRSCGFWVPNLSRTRSGTEASPSRR